MNPLTDKVTYVPDGRGGTIEVRQPGALNPSASANWRFTREAYQRYEPQIIEAVKNWPAETSFAVPPSISVNTFVRCLREARTALLEFNYNPDLATRLRAINDEITVSMDPSGTKVWFRQKQQVGRPKRANKVLVDQVKRPLFEAGAVQSLPTPDDLRAMCTLMKSNRITGPFHFHGRFDADLIASIESAFDVAFAYDAVTDTTTLL